MVYDLDMALVPQKAKSISDSQLDGLLEQLSKGVGIHEIAKKVHPNDRIARQRLRRQLYKALASDELVAKAIGERARVELLAGLIAGSRALARRAARGNVQAIKLINETTGLHNPRVQHEHSGEITIKLDLPRPAFDATSEPSATIEDAEVV